VIDFMPHRKGKETDAVNDLHRHYRVSYHNMPFEMILNAMRETTG
jgi:hypothetical protein